MLLYEGVVGNRGSVFDTVWFLTYFAAFFFNSIEKNLLIVKIFFSVVKVASTVYQTDNCSGDISRGKFQQYTALMTIKTLHYASS